MKRAVQMHRKVTIFDTVENESSKSLYICCQGTSGSSAYKTKIVAFPIV